MHNPVYERLGVRPIINASSWRTVIGGSIMPPEVVEAMAQASRSFVDMFELNREAGKVIARATGAEGGLVCASAAAGLLLQAAACMTGTDTAKIDRLPDTTGMKNEIVMHRRHRMGHDRGFRTAGAKVVYFGDVDGATEADLKAAINERTAAVAYVFASPQGGALPLTTVAEIAHAHGVPVIVDAAAMLPPAENLRRYIDMGADMVAFSGGKGVHGPQATGILCGRADLIEAAVLNAAPNTVGVGRVAKVGKEEIVGLVTALELFVAQDWPAVYARWDRYCIDLAARICEIPGLRSWHAPATEIDDVHTATPSTFIVRDPAVEGPSQRDVARLLQTGEPRIYTSGDVSGAIVINPTNIQPGEDEIVVRRLQEIMAG